MELNEDKLENVLGGNSQNMGEETALNNPELFRQKRIEELKKLKEDLGQDTELSEEELRDRKLERKRDATYLTILNFC